MFANSAASIHHHGAGWKAGPGQLSRIPRCWAASPQRAGLVAEREDEAVEVQPLRVRLPSSGVAAEGHGRAGPGASTEIAPRHVSEEGPSVHFGTGAPGEKEAEENGTESAFQGIATSARVYGELENLGATEGWRHLRTVVRAHGVKAVGDAITEGLFNTTFSELLVKLCARSQAYLEAEELLDALVSTHRLPRRCSDRTDQAVQDRGPICPRGRSCSDSWPGCCLAESLPEEWLSTLEFDGLWLRASRAISSSAGCEDAMRFASASIAVLCNASHRPGRVSAAGDAAEKSNCVRRRAYTSIVASLGAMLIIGRNSHFSTTAEGESTDKAYTISRRIVTSCTTVSQ